MSHFWVVHMGALGRRAPLRRNKSKTRSKIGEGGSLGSKRWRACLHPTAHILPYFQAARIRRFGLSDRDDSWALMSERYGVRGKEGTTQRQTVACLGNVGWKEIFPVAVRSQRDRRRSEEDTQPAVSHFYYTLHASHDSLYSLAEANSNISMESSSQWIRVFEA